MNVFLWDQVIVVLEEEVLLPGTEYVKCWESETYCEMFSSTFIYGKVTLKTIVFNTCEQWSKGVIPAPLFNLYYVPNVLLVSRY